MAKILNHQQNTPNRVKPSSHLISNKAPTKLSAAALLTSLRHSGSTLPKLLSTVFSLSGDPYQSPQPYIYTIMACTIDFRYLDEGFGGKTYKRKRSAQTEDNHDVSMEIDNDNMDNEGTCPPSKRPALPSSENPDKPTFGRPTYDGVIAGRVSGRNWKQPRKQRASAAKVSHKGTTFEQRAKQKEIKKAYTERINELKEEIRANKVEKRKKKEEREKKKQENILKTGTKLQKITNPKTLKKIAKSKQRKLLKVVPDDMLKK